LTKSLDATRPVVVNDGCEHTVSDILTLQDYEEFGEKFASRYRYKEPIVRNERSFSKHKLAFAGGYEYKGQPIIISEYGGSSLGYNSKAAAVAASAASVSNTNLMYLKFVKTIWVVIFRGRLFDQVPCTGYGGRKFKFLLLKSSLIYLISTILH
jgi:hypothetical protein